MIEVIYGHVVLRLLIGHCYLSFFHLFMCHLQFTFIIEICKFLYKCI